MIIRDFDVVGITSLSKETDPILLIDTDTVLTPTFRVNAPARREGLIDENDSDQGKDEEVE